ncbi:hypothetical protein O181_041683 [Austropuccinia psidii MF-1]|uniref:Integrase catalytic domain-containing protein n=1 Tax=Austropuccinia psidii MF-1 TaxID=1389203 RepID=A0A9Q3HE13_9BASI|nr:hypothetical protein [Austropuccinia psidii MF-1]
MDWVTALPPGRNKSHNACIVLVNRYRETPMFLPFHEDATSMDTAIMIWNKGISHTGLFQNIISDRDPKFTSALWKNLHNLFGPKLSFSTAYHPQTDGLTEIMIQTLEDMTTRFCAYYIEFRDSYGFTNYWCTLIPALELEYKTSIYSLTEVSFKVILEKAEHHANRCIQDSVQYEKERWDKTYKPPDFKVGDLLVVSTLNFNNIKGQMKLKDSFVGPFMIKALHGPNAVQLELTGQLMSRNPTFPVSMIKSYSSSDKQLLPLRKKPTPKIPALEEGEENKVIKVPQERRTRNKREKEYLLRYRNPTQEDEWLVGQDITNYDKLLRRLINLKRPSE